MQTTGSLGPHTPVPVSQTPGRWHRSDAGQFTGELPVHTPAWQLSVWVQALLSLHAVPSAFAGLEHAPVAVFGDLSDTDRVVQAIVGAS